MSKVSGNQFMDQKLQNDRVTKDSNESKENFQQFKGHKRNSSTKFLNFQHLQTNQKSSPQQLNKESYHVSNFSINSQFSLISHERKSSDAESVIYLGNKDNQVQKSIELPSSIEIERSKKQTMDINLSMSADSLEKSLGKSPLTAIRKKDGSINSTFNLSISGDFMLSIPSILSSQQNNNQLVKQSVKQLEISQVKTQELPVQKENTNELYLFCNQCGEIKKADLFYQKQHYKWKSGFLNTLSEIVCCFNKAKVLKKETSKVGFRCCTCKNFNVMLNDLQKKE